MSTLHYHWYANPPILDIYGFAFCGQLVKILIALLPYRIFGSNSAYLILLILSINPGMQNGGEGLLSIILPVNVD